MCLIQVIAEDSPVGDLIMKHVDPGYKHCFLRAFSKRNLTEYDVELNGIYDGAYDEAREFVKDYENILSRKRNMTPKVQCFYVPSFRCLTQTNGDRCAKLLKCCSIKKTLKKYFCSTAESGSSRSPTVDQPEIYHLNHILSVDPQWWDTINPHSAGDFKESDSRWLFFNAVAKYYGTLTSTAEFTVKR